MTEHIFSVKLALKVISLMQNPIHNIALLFVFVNQLRLALADIH